MDSKAECDQLKRGHGPKTYNRQCPLSAVQVKIREGCLEGIRRLWRTGFVKEMSFKSVAKDRGSDRW